MNEAQRRHLAVSVRYIGQLIDESRRMIRSGSIDSPFAWFKSDLTDAQTGPFATAMDHFQGDLVRFASRFQLDISGNAVNVVHAVRVQLSVAGVSLTEMRPRYMRGYGELDPQTARDLDSACEALETALRRVQEVVDQGTE